MSFCSCILDFIFYCLCFFFFKQKSADEMRISYWSSDVCSSDLGFGLINEWRIVRQTRSGQMSEIKVTLSDWLFKMVEGRSVLTLHRDYFRLRKPLERRIYELARKHCGAQEKWSISVETLQKKTGASSHLRVFRSMLRDLVAHDHLP